MAFFSITAVAQQKNVSQKDSIIYKKNYGLRLGIDMSKLLIGATDSHFSGYELVVTTEFKKTYTSQEKLDLLKKPPKKTTTTLPPRDLT